MFANTALKFTAEEPPQRQQYANSEEYLQILSLWVRMYASYTGLQKLLGAICVSSFGSDKALHKRANKLAQDPQHTLPQRQIAEELPEFQKRLKDWGAAFIAALQGVQVQLPPDLQKETAWDTFSRFPQLVEGKGFSEAELGGAFQEVQDDLKDRDLEAHDWVAGITFWPLLCEETKALARTKPKKQVGGQGKPVAVKYSWEYQKEVMAEASPTLDPRHTRYDWVPSVASGILCVISGSTGVDMEISTLHKSLLSAAGTSDGKLADLTLQAILSGGVSALTNPDFESMSVETVRQLRQLSSKFASKYDKHFSPSGSRNQKEKEKGSHEKREGSDENGQRRQNGQSEKSHSESSSSSSSGNSFSLSESDVSHIAAQILQMQEKKQSEKEKEKEGEKGNGKKEKVRFSEERVRMANASCGAELQELVRHGGRHVDIVFDYSELPFALQDIPIYEVACATEGEGSEMTAVSSTSEENKEGGGNFDSFQDYLGGEAAFKARFVHC